MHDRYRGRKRISLTFGLVSALLFAGFSIFLLANNEIASQAVSGIIEKLSSIAALCIVATLLTYNRPENRIGWLVMVAAITRQMAYAELWADISLAKGAEITWGLIWWANLGSFLTGVTYTLLALVMVLFPSGRLPSRRWRAAVWLFALLAALTAGLLLYLAADLARILADADKLGELLLSPLTAWGPFSVANHLRPTPELQPLLWLVTVIAVSLVILGLVSLIVRLPGSKGIERQQIKWMLFAVAIWVVGLLLAVLPLGIPFSIITPIGPLPAIALLVAILRYRLYDIDLIIRRTLIYGTLTGLLAVAYFASAAILQTLFTAVTRQDSPLVIVLSTLGIIALFAPLRRRVQHLIDRRFYRRQYDAEQILARFAETAHDEIAIEELSAELLGVVERTMLPESASIWLRED